MKLVHYVMPVLIVLVLAACGGSGADNYIPKPKGYNRLDMPAHAYQPLAETHPFRFEYSKHARILPDTFRGAQPHWLFIYYPEFKANVQLTYHPVMGKPERVAKMVEDAYKLAAKHNEKAYAFKEQTLRLPSGQGANLITISGEVPSQLQFYTTDTTNHFLRGALYFNTATENDSLAPVIEYIRKDVMHLLNTLRWKK
ncbi:gliding motility lipoprotein GldD [Tellurirhabdus bombi]|uniref:gliding motility lipoprotein GldD n=1 Tax=Tellurirhabdus bombi TaxID=2907205 RepID=UPI001F43BF6F|nr:gliding motility lipoprotein GldD [Tellurirhabdus bombi]